MMRVVLPRLGSKERIRDLEAEVDRLKARVARLRERLRLYEGENQ